MVPFASNLLWHSVDESSSVEDKDNSRGEPEFAFHPKLFANNKKCSDSLLKSTASRIQHNH